MELDETCPNAVSKHLIQQTFRFYVKSCALSENVKTKLPMIFNAKYPFMTIQCFICS